MLLSFSFSDKANVAIGTLLSIQRVKIGICHSPGVLSPKRLPTQKFNPVQNESYVSALPHHCSTQMGEKASWRPTEALKLTQIHPARRSPQVNLFIPVEYYEEL